MPSIQPIPAQDLIRLRRDNQTAKMYLSFPSLETVWTATINQAFSTTDRVYQLAYTGAVAQSTPQAGMTLLVGTTAGARDLGICRVRTVPSGGTVGINETSEIQWANGAFLTIVNDYQLWARQLTVRSNVAYMDYNVAYSDQHSNCNPVPVLGPPAVIWIVDGVATVDFDASDSFVPGSTISGYSWSAPGSSSSSGMLTASPTVNYANTGTYWVDCTVTATNGKTTVGHRVVVVVSESSMPVEQFTLSNLSANYEEGGWTFKVTLYEFATMTDIPDRQMCILHSEDWYGDEKISLGQIPGRENVVCWGWIAGETVRWAPDYSSVTFEVRGPAYWLQKISAFPQGIEDTQSAPDAWTLFQNLTVDAMLWHVLYWRSTMAFVCDVYLSGDTRRAQSLESPASSLWTQILAIAQQSILASPACDRYGRLFVEIDQQYLPVASRTTLPVVMAVTTEDIVAQVEFAREWMPRVALLDLSGIYWNGSTPTAFFSLANGHVFKGLGDADRIDRLLLWNSQTLSNQLAGLIIGKKNNNYPSFPVELASNNRFIDIAPRQYVTLSLAAGDTVRGIVFASSKFIPRNLTYNIRVGVVTLQADLEAETFPEIAVTGDYPTDPPVTPDEVAPAPVAISPGSAIFALVATESTLKATMSLLAVSPIWGKKR